MSELMTVYDQAVKLKNEGKLQESVELFEKILQEDKDHAITHSALAVVYQKLGNADSAIQHALRVVEIEPADPFSFAQLSVICQRCGQIQQAEDAMARARMIQAGVHHPH